MWALGLHSFDCTSLGMAVLLGVTVWRLGMSYLVFSVTGRPLFMVVCSAVVAMAASFPETAGY